MTQSLFHVSNKNNWVENQSYWIEKTKHLEDRLSDRLHEELTKTFIDKRASVLARGLKQDMEFKTEILQNNDVKIDDQFIGKIKGLKSREIVEYGIEALKAVWHRGAVDADGKTGDGARSEERRVGKECRSRWSPYH